jgi:hypothetical protein
MSKTFYFLRGPHLHGTTVLAYETAQDRDTAVWAKRQSNIQCEPIEWDEVCRIVEPDADGKRLVWGDFPNGGPTRL